MDKLKHKRPRFLRGVGVSLMPDVVTAGGQYENGSKSTPIYQAFKIQGFRDGKTIPERAPERLRVMNYAEKASPSGSTMSLPHHRQSSGAGVPETPATIPSLRPPSKKEHRDGTTITNGNREECQMDYRITRQQEEIDRVLNCAAEGEDNGSHYGGMSYENGIKAMFDWLTGMRDEAPDEG